MPVAASGGSTASSTLSSQLAAANPSNPGSDTANSISTAKENDGILKKPVNTSNRAIVTASDIPADPPAIPFTPRRLSFPGRLSLQTSSRGPLSPVLDPALGYSVARRPRLDFARACLSSSLFFGPSSVDVLQALLYITPHLLNLRRIPHRSRQVGIQFHVMSVASTRR